MSAKSARSLRTWLALLVLGVAVPLIVFAGVTIGSILGANQQERDNALGDRARAIASAVDAETRSWRAALYALAESPDLRAGRLQAFYAEAKAVAARYEGWIVLNDATGQQRLNTFLPPDAPLPHTAAGEMVAAVLHGGKPVTDLVFGAAAQRYIISNSVPVFQDGKVVLCLSLNFGPERLTRLLAEQKLPPTWVAGIVNRQNRVVARSIKAEERIGKPAPLALQQAVGRSDAGLVNYTLTDGREGRVAFQRLAESPWVLVLAVPLAELPTPRPLIGFVLIGILLAGVAVAAAIVIARKIAQPIGQLADRAPTLVRGDRADADVASGIAEVRQLQHALVEAAEQARAHAQERERAAEALERVNVYTRSLIEASLDPLVTIGPDGKITDVNAATEAATGQARTALIGTDFSSYFTEPERARAGYEQVFRDGLVRDYPLELRHRDGRTMPVLYNASVYRDEAGKVIGVFAAARDITERKRAEEALHRLNEELEARVLERTAAVQEANIKLEVANSQLQQAALHMEEVNVELEQEVEERQRAEAALIEANAALRESESRYRGLVELAPDAVLVYQDAHVVYANAAALRLYGAPSIEHLRGKHVLDLVHPADCDLAWARMQQAQGGGTAQLRELRHRRLDGQEVPVEATAAPATWQGKPAVQVITRDITERRQVEANQVLLTDILRTFNRGGELPSVIAETLRLIRDASGFEAVGLRVRQGEDCPYYEQSGFSDEFLRQENFLCAHGGDGAILRDADGRPVLECTCGLVLSGRTDPSLPGFTEGGSFWSNVSSELLALPRETDPRTNPRNRCIHAGYQSVGLFPVRAGTEIIGLLQLNDRREGRFTPELIAFYESVAQNIGLALQRAAAEEALRQAHAELEQKVRERTAELSQAVERLEEQSRRLRTLAAELTQAEERERQRVATVLHDDLQQILVGAKLVLTPLTQQDDPKVQAASREVSDLIMRSLHCSRSLTEELSPPILHRGGLVPALDWLAKWMAEKYRLRVEVRASGPVLLESRETAVLLFRAVRELLFNAAKHAKVEAATVEITERDGQVRVGVSDAGVGFDPSQLRVAGGTAGGFGLFSLRERLEYLGGSLEIESAPGKGSRFTLWLPAR